MKRLLPKNVFSESKQKDWTKDQEEKILWNK